MSLFNSLVDGMTWLLNFFYNLTQEMGIASYGLAIIIFTIVVKTALLPLTIKQMKSMKVMQAIQPKIKEIQEKHKDPQKANAAIMEVYKTHGANPLSGCLPILLQMPIFIALFMALKEFKYIDEAHAVFLGIFHLSKYDGFYILPVLAGLSTYFQQKLTTTNIEDPTQKMLLYMMPVMFAWFASTVPSGLALYWVVFNVVGAVQQYFINKQPMVLKEDIKKNEGSGKKRKNN